MNTDHLNMAPVGEVARGTMSLVNVLQNMPAHIQVASVTSLFLLLSEFRQVKPQDAFQVASNIMNHADGRRPEFVAARAYMDGELEP